MTKKIIVLLVLLFSFSAVSYTQTTSVTGTITDSDSIVWTNATWSVTFKTNNQQSNPCIYQLSGVSLCSNTWRSYLNQSGTSDPTSGLISLTLLDNSQISPTGTSWVFTIQSNTSAPATQYAPIAVSGASNNLTTFFSSNAAAPRFSALGVGYHGYNDVEVFPTPVIGAFYFNVNLNQSRMWTGSAFTPFVSSCPSGCVARNGDVMSGSLLGPQLGNRFFFSHNTNAQTAINNTASAGNSIAINDTATFGGFTNSSHVSIDFPDQQHHWAGFIFPEIGNPGAYGDGVHDDTTAIQDCINQSSTLSGTHCALLPLSKYLINSQLTIPDHANFGGSRFTVIQNEFNGYPFKIAAGAVTNVQIGPFTINDDPALPNSGGFDITAIAAAGPYCGTLPTCGGLWQSVFNQVSVFNAASRCISIVAGGGIAGYTYNLPVQELSFYDFGCNLANQSHPEPGIFISGQAQKINFYGGYGIQALGPTISNYPILFKIVNPNPAQPGGSPGPINIGGGFTFQTGQIGLSADSSVEINVHDAYFESLNQIASLNAVSGFSFTDILSQSATWGTQAITSSNSWGRIADISIGGTPSPSFVATCTNSNQIDFGFNGIVVGSTSYIAQSQNCNADATTITPAATINALSCDIPIAGDSCAVPISTIKYPTGCKTSTLFATVASFCLASGGNINFNGITSPLTIPAGQSITLKQTDYQFSSNLQFINPPIQSYLPRIRVGPWTITTGNSSNTITFVPAMSSAPTGCTISFTTDVTTQNPGQPWYTLPTASGFTVNIHAAATSTINGEYICTDNNSN